MDTPAFVSPVVFSEISGRNVYEIRKLANMGELPCERIGKHMKIPVNKALEVLVERANKNMLNKPSQILPNRELSEEKANTLKKLLS